MSEIEEPPHLSACSQSVKSAAGVASSNLRLLVVSHTYVVRTNREKWEAVHELAPGWDITVITPMSWGDPEFGVRMSAPGYCNRLRFTPLRTIGRSAGRYAFVSPRLVWQLKRLNPDVFYVEAEPWSAVYLQLAFLRRLAVPAARLAVFSWWNTTRWSTPLRFPGSRSYAIGLKATDLLIAGNHGAAQLHRAHGFKGPVEVIPQLGVDPVSHSPGVRDEELVRRFNLDSRFVIGYVGRLHSRKGVAVLLDAVGRMGRANSTVLIVGDGAQKGDLMSHAARLGIADRVIFTGFVAREEIPRYMRLMNVLVLPSLEEQWEQFGHVLIEAMACGVSVVGSRSGEIPWVIGDDRFVFPIGDSCVLADRLARLFDEPGVAMECQELGLDRVHRLYSHHAVARRLIAAFELLRRPQGRQ